MKARVKISILILAIVLFPVFSSAMAQDMTMESGNDQFSIYGTLGGYAIMYSAGFEYMTADRHLGLNVNFSYETFRDDGTYTMYFIPIFASFYAGGTNHRFFADAGMNYVYASVKDSTKYSNSSGNGIMGIAGLGYAYTPADGGFYFKIGPKILFSAGYFQFWGGISLGYTF